MFMSLSFVLIQKKVTKEKSSTDDKQHIGALPPM
jgi:hypothetical protein